MTVEKILYILKENASYISGEEISRVLGISRAAVWKYIGQLKRLGYEIVAVPHLGYQLRGIPDRLFPHEVLYRLNTKFIGKNIYYFDTLDSTMDVATKLGLEGKEEGTLVVAERQTRGRGRLGRKWFSPKYKGIYLSLILRPKIPPQKAGCLTLLAAVSTVEAVKKVTDLDIQIKWPNDLILSYKKVGGILTEINAETDETHFMVIGIGINVNNEKKDLISGATSLKQERKEEVNRILLLQELLWQIEKNYLLFHKEGAHPIIEKWRLLSITLGKRVKVYFQKNYLEGEAVDIDSDGSLILKNNSGLIQKVICGDVFHCR
ncbi:MAG: biotin--[acetyl-CoA-carboxylase] ligase [Candidatus Omnitrophica bacterium]|nr:biotin--[acetyl-CoA-carboxylase] ligase [Candidatus Omnitrophota bacterium]